MSQPGLRRLLPQAPLALCNILEPGRGPVQAPIRSEIFGPERFAQHGRSLGETHRAELVRARKASFFPRLRGNIEALREAHRYIGEQASTGYDISPAAEWLLDNFHLIEAQLKEIHEGLPRSYFRMLPVLQDEPLAGLPRVYGIAWAFVAHTDGAFDEELMVHFLAAYQETRALNLAEVWALPTTLRVVLVENLRRLAERVATNKAARAVANLCCDAIDDYPPARLDALLALMQQRGVGPVFLAHMAQRLQERRTSAVAGAPDPLLDWLARVLPDPAAVQTRQPADQAADNLSVSNAVTSLRAIGDADWPDIIARTSTLMRLLLTSPTFQAEHSLTRDDSLHAIERLARRCGRSETEVGQTLLALMRSGKSADGTEAVASHWLRGPGRPQLLRALGLQEHPGLATGAALRRLALPAYLGALVLGTAGLVAWMAWRHASGQHGSGVPGWLTLAGTLLMLFPASEAVVAVINRLISESARPWHLPRLALKDGIPPQHRAMVVVPCMLTSADGAQALVHRLQLHYLANPERHAQFALLSDWADAATEHLPGDATLLQAAAHAIETLNLRHPAAPDEPTRFILLHRGRSYSATEQAWIGWERKRGKLELLVTALATNIPVAPSPGFARPPEGVQSFLGRPDERRGPFHDLGPLSRIASGTRYLVTLDSDTGLPPGRLRELVGVAAHPHNLPRLDTDGRRVVAGYGILQPRIVTPLPSLREVTLYHWLFAGQCGIDPYSAASSEVYQDIFGEGTFTGKGLLNVQAVHAVLCGRLPEGQVLSHDLLEGSMARCAAVTDISLIEDAPFHSDVAMSRVHRWTRGDWQLLPFLLRPWRYPVRTINRWKMFDNLRRSLVAPVSLALLLLALGGAVLSPWAALALVLAAFGAGPVMGAMAGFSPSRDDIAKRHFYRQAATELARALAGAMWLLAQLLQHALMAVDAITRALYRMQVSRRHLLQWTTAAAAAAQARNAFADVLRQHWSLPPVALLLLGALLAAGTPVPGLALALCLLWAASPLWTWWVSRRPEPRPDTLLTDSNRATLEAIAHDTWNFFERCVGPDDNHLPPDNLQTLPHDMLAHRTSPTNIGLYLLAAACARQFGWIDTAALTARLDATLATLDRLERHRGHFLNWYDTQSCAPLLPMYVSAVDSGNLSGHLLAVAQACLELARQPQETAHAARLQALALRCQTLAWQADFHFLYHPKRHLFHIGYRVAEQQLDASFYDLLASESRLTSLLAIAKGDVPVGHWSALGRPFFAVGSRAGLRSWSGSMFEYLMPTLVLNEPHGSVLRDACRSALVEQMVFGQAHAVPWGLSESAYAASDHTLAYQYAPQGVPRLALRRTPPDELVVAPYATALAAQIAPRRALANFAALERLAPHGSLGFMDALDFTPARLGTNTAFTPVSTFMAHHQGMTVVALANVLLDNVAQRWGMANPHIEAVASLLHERAPREVSVLYAPPPAPAPQSVQRRAPGLLRELVPGALAVAPTHVLSNGRYSVTLRANGAGWSRWGQTGISRWRDDALRDACGSFLYLRERDPQTRPVSLTQHPAPDPGALYRSTFHADRVCFDAIWPHMRAHTTVWVSPEDDIEFRQLEIHNLDDEDLVLDILSAFDASLADPRADEAHPAFTNLFVRAQWQAQQQALLLARTPRLDTEQGLQVAHFLADSDPQVTGLTIQTDRAQWLGRNRAAHQPLARFDPLPGADDAPDAQAALTLGTGLDPVCALCVQLRITPHAKATLTFATAASDRSDTLRAVIDKYRLPSNVQRASLMSATLSGIRLRALALGPENFAAMQTLTTALVFCLTRPQPHPALAQRSKAAEVCDRQLLWRFGISGDRPIILVWAGAAQGLGLLRSLSQALRLWSWGSIACDLVVVNAEPTSYLMALQRELAALREQHLADSSAQGGPSSTGIYLLRAEEVSGEELDTLRNLARLQFNADGRPLLHHVQEWCAQHEQAQGLRDEAPATSVATASGRQAAAAPQGAFDAATGEFRFDVNPRLRPARPWINVLSNPAFGAQLSEAGGGFSWAVNSRSMQLTAWSNDPVADPPSEWFLLQDCQTGQAWSATPSAWGDERCSYRVAHGQGYSVVSHRRGDLEVTASWCVDAATSVKQVRIRLVNRGHKEQQLRLVGIAEWMMGANRADRATVQTASHAQALEAAQDPALDGELRAAGALRVLLATQKERSAGFGNGTAFLALAGSADGAEDWTCDRRECFDARGRLVLPDLFGQRSGAGLDPCAALASRFTLAAGDAQERVFLLGYGDTPEAARTLAGSAAAMPARQRMEVVRTLWDGLLGATTVHTPDPLFDAMVNRWLLYQTITCRMWAKAGFYQAGGATGFRDQLQDAMALAWAAPDMLRQQIVVCASRQYPQGDVQHWWHAPLGAGVRTHFSDDLLWLPYACVHYLRSTGDTHLLDQQVPFIDGAAIPEGAEDAYYTPSVSAELASVYEHGARAIDRSLRVGSHGLPLMGSGDWNDGMNRVGIAGRGESVWLGWFLWRLVQDFAPLARHRGDTERAQRWEAAATGWHAALMGPAWDGQWYKRAFFDDGQAFGSHANPEARIDLIAQAWAVLSGAAPLAAQRMALAAVESQLMDHAGGLIRLLDPPLAHAQPSAGYIQAYPPGVRENGGQYSHAGVWALMAQARFATRYPQDSGADGDSAYRSFTWLSPAHRAQHPTQGPAYGIEPYVMAGDVYSQPPYVGRGGWSWYTGSAAWMHRAAIESLFGLQLDAQTLCFTPCLPSHWPRAELVLRRAGRSMCFILLRTAAAQAQDAARAQNAQLLLPGAALQWTGLEGDTRFLVPLPERPVSRRAVPKANSTAAEGEGTP